MNKIKFDETETEMNQLLENHLYIIFYTLRQKIDDPLEKKIKN